MKKLIGLLLLGLSSLSMAMDQANMSNDDQVDELAKVWDINWLTEEEKAAIFLDSASAMLQNSGRKRKDKEKTDFEFAQRLDAQERESQVSHKKQIAEDEKLANEVFQLLQWQDEFQADDIKDKSKQDQANQGQAVEKDCVICFEEITRDQRRALACGHNQFHHECLEKWKKIGRNTTCPVCRSAEIN